MTLKMLFCHFCHFRKEYCEKTALFYDRFSYFLASSNITSSTTKVLLFGKNCMEAHFFLLNIISTGYYGDTDIFRASLEIKICPLLKFFISNIVGNIF